MLLVPSVYKDTGSHNPFAAQAGTTREQKFAVLSAHLMGTERQPFRSMASLDRASPVDKAGRRLPLLLP